MKASKWCIKFKVVDKEAKRKGDKYVLANLNVTVPSGFIDSILIGIAESIERIDVERLND